MTTEISVMYGSEKVKYESSWMPEADTQVKTIKEETISERWRIYRTSTCDVRSPLSRHCAVVTHGGSSLACGEPQYKSPAGNERCWFM